MFPVQASKGINVNQLVIFGDGIVFESYSLVEWPRILDGILDSSQTIISYEIVDRTTSSLGWDALLF